MDFCSKSNTQISWLSLSWHTFWVNVVAVSILPNHENEWILTELLLCWIRICPNQRNISYNKKKQIFWNTHPTNNFTRHSHHSEKWGCFPSGPLKSDGACGLFRSILQSEKTGAIRALQQLFPAVVYTSAPKLEMPLLQKKTINPSNFLHQVTT